MRKKWDGKSKILRVFSALFMAAVLGIGVAGAFSPAPVMAYGGGHKVSFYVKHARITHVEITGYDTDGNYKEWSPRDCDTSAALGAGACQYRVTAPYLYTGDVTVSFTVVPVTGNGWIVQMAGDPISDSCSATVDSWNVTVRYDVDIDNDTGSCY